MSDQARTTQQAKSTAQAAKAQKPVKVDLSASVQSVDSLPLAIADPRAASTADVLRLQRVAGNRAVARLIQTKLSVGPASDRYEQETDRVAQRVLTAFNTEHSREYLLHGARPHCKNGAVGQRKGLIDL